MKHEELKDALAPMSSPNRRIKNNLADASTYLADLTASHGSAERKQLAEQALPGMLEAILKDIDELNAQAEKLRGAIMGAPQEVTLTHAAREALSYIITTATEGGDYTREDFRKWTDYRYNDEPNGRFYAEVTVHPNADIQNLMESPDCMNPIRMTPEELGKRLKHVMDHGKTNPEQRRIIYRLLDGDEDVAGECDVIDAGCLMQLAVYGEVIYG